MENEFQNIGKKMPYAVPEGFFDHITRDTLTEARRRQKSRKYRTILWSSLAVAASLGAILFLATRFAPGINEKTSSPIVQSSPWQPSVREIEIPPDASGVRAVKHNPAQQESSGNQVKEILVSENESLESVLASINDDDLILWVQSLKNDPFEEITENNIP
jgi:hypothetical protein